MGERAGLMMMSMGNGMGNGMGMSRSGGGNVSVSFSSFSSSSSSLVHGERDFFSSSLSELGGSGVGVEAGVAAAWVGSRAALVERSLALAALAVAHARAEASERGAAGGEEGKGYVGGGGRRTLRWTSERRLRAGMASTFGLPGGLVAALVRVGTMGETVDEKDEEKKKD